MWKSIDYCCFNLRTWRRLFQLVKLLEWHAAQEEDESGAASRPIASRQAWITDALARARRNWAAHRQKAAGEQNDAAAVATTSGALALPPPLDNSARAMLQFRLHEIFDARSSDLPSDEVRQACKDNLWSIFLSLTLGLDEQA